MRLQTWCFALNLRNTRNLGQPFRRSCVPCAWRARGVRVACARGIPMVVVAS